ncbi:MULTISPECIES: hypothetical protein [Streptomyces]|uniref:hypothetical protein n=1 Tax=Streptomyces TaxID=1883 RepID=UPI00224C920C|nr:MULTISPECIES: hypothetical protein [Streptomyces]MCX5275324.1 hypothetical protein [Streptomyces virginiae]MCX5582934.1 hypothetical protein [Streptomyces erythrochromogenes]
MLRRLPLSLRAWPGVLLVCALFVCLSGLARPAMAVGTTMPGSMDMSPQVTAVGHAGASVVARSVDHSPGCPVAQEQCVAPKGVLAQDGPSGQVPAAESSPIDCSPSLLVAQPNAPPLPAEPPDLHRLCVSRT